MPYKIIGVASLTYKVTTIPFKIDINPDKNLWTAKVYIFAKHPANKAHKILSISPYIIAFLLEEFTHLKKIPTKKIPTNPPHEPKEANIPYNEANFSFGCSKTFKIRKFIEKLNIPISYPTKKFPKAAHIV